MADSVEQKCNYRIRMTAVIENCDVPLVFEYNVPNEVFWAAHTFIKTQLQPQ
jgi:hypothetical protein